MKSLCKFGIALFGLIASIAGAQSVPIPAPPAVAAKSYILQDFNSGKILAERDADIRLQPASITKIMTAYVVFDAIKNGQLTLAEKALISDKAWRNPEVQGWMQGSRMFAEVNSRVAINDLLRGLIIQSGNDASIALAEHIAGSEVAFVALMNDYAARLGLQNTQYQNVTGWPAENHYTSAQDIASLSRALIKNFPELYKLYSEKRFTYNNIAQSNRNTLLWKDESVDGLKTGYTEAAGYCLVVSAQRNDMRLISVVMGASSREARIKYNQSLLNYGFRFYQTHRLFTAGESLKAVRVWKGREDAVQLGLVQDVYLTIPRGQYSELQPRMDIKKSVFAPVEKNQELGSLSIQLQDEILYQQAIVALDTVERGNFLQRLVDQIAYFFQ